MMLEKRLKSVCDTLSLLESIHGAVSITGMRSGGLAFRKVTLQKFQKLKHLNIVMIPIQCSASRGIHATRCLFLFYFIFYIKKWESQYKQCVETNVKVNSCQYARQLNTRSKKEQLNNVVQRLNWSKGCIISGIGN